MRLPSAGNLRLMGKSRVSGSFWMWMNTICSMILKNAEQIKDCITKNNRQIQGVDDMPYLIAIGMDFPLDLNKEYGAILGMYHEDNATIPVKAFLAIF